ncbi:DUF433 domain-containing protein [Gordonia sp. PP30]|uniref:DUF433 domain-containing protein n=1 Tax=Gordonia sp. PP30 TaxID=2935861 RepID=UPI001FFE586F|nr:DUF433 domain-containing protein [Gordonia sp. PP30]UQE75108.1 DUF433 domain-containing protein [Gordonia sp. PP30]
MTGFPVELTIALTGVTRSQLDNWRRTELLIPEVNPTRPPLYSFRDLVALRTVAWLRTSTSLQKVRRAFAQLEEFDLTDHPSAYKFAVGGGSIAVWTDAGFMDLVKTPGQYQLYTLADMFRPFNNRNDEPIVDFQRPRPTLTVDPRKLGGWPTIDGTRVPFDTVADALSGDLPISEEQVRAFYPGVSPSAAHDALDFAELVSSKRRTS